MKGMNGEWSRRGFVLGSAAAAAMAGGCRSWCVDECKADPNLTAFLSDIHVSGLNVKGQPTYQNPLFEKVIDAVLALRPRPQRAVVLGDIALWNGRHEDYEASLPGLERLRQAGVELFVAMGNHDHRDVFLRYHPEYAKISPVADRIISVVDLGSADLLLLDSLKETGRGEGTGNAVEGEIDDAQWSWLEAQATSRERPFFVASHHQPDDLSGRKMREMLASTKYCVGYLHGHCHRWMTTWFKKNYQSRRIVRVAGVPSTGWWGDIGYTLLRTGPDHAELAMAPGNDFFFPSPLKPGESRPREWDDIRSEHANARCVFSYGA